VPILGYLPASNIFLNKKTARRWFPVGGLIPLFKELPAQDNYHFALKTTLFEAHEQSSCEIFPVSNREVNLDIHLAEA
jgi:hypothetical protein